MRKEVVSRRKIKDEEKERMRKNNMKCESNED